MHRLSCRGIGFFGGRSGDLSRGDCLSKGYFSGLGFFGCPTLWVDRMIGTSSDWRLSSYSTVRDPVVDIGDFFQVEGGDGVRGRDQEFVASIGTECSDDGEVEEVAFLVHICAVFDG